MGNEVGMKAGVCLPLALILLLLSSRSTVECIATLVLGPSPSPAMASAKSSEAGATDRKPKPTRQQDRQSGLCLLRLKWMSLSRPVLPGVTAWDAASWRSETTSGSVDSGTTSVRITKPTYLRPSVSAPRGQLPPPEPSLA